MSAIRIVLVCLLSLCLVAPVFAQSEPKNVPSLQDAQTIADIGDYVQHEREQFREQLSHEQIDVTTAEVKLAEIMLAAHVKVLEIAKTYNEKVYAHTLKFAALVLQRRSQVTGAEQKMETFLQELESQPEFSSLANQYRFELFQVESAMTDNFDTFKQELKKWINRKISMFEIARVGFVYVQQHKESVEQFAAELIDYVQSAECTLSTREKKEAVKVIKNHETEFRFYAFTQNAYASVNTPESFKTFKTELQTFIGGESAVSISSIAGVGIRIAEMNNVPAEQFVKELTEYIRSPECRLSSSAKKQAEAVLETILRTTLGSDPKLYGKTLDNKDFDWESLRGKYVLIKFTATWCGPCKGEIPGMLEAYQNYHDKGFEIISVYIWEHGADPVDTVRRHVEKEKLPWIILSEALTVKEGEGDKSLWGSIAALAKPAKPQPQGEYYGIEGVPTMLLVNKEGKIIMTDARGDALQAKLAEIFK